MEYRINDYLVIDCKDLDEEFCYIEAYADGTDGILDYYPDPIRDRELYNKYDTTQCLYPDRGSRVFHFAIGSLSEYLEVISYLVDKGWEHYLLLSEVMNWRNLLDGYCDEDHKRYKGKGKLPGRIFKKNIITPRKILEFDYDKYYRENPNSRWPDPIYGYTGHIRGYSFRIRVDFNKLDKFRKDMQSIKGYKTLWKNNGKGIIMK